MRKILFCLAMIILITAIPAGAQIVKEVEMTGYAITNNLTDTLVYRAADSAYYQIIDKDGNPLTQAIYIDLYQQSGFPFFKATVVSEDGIHNTGILDAQGNVIVPTRYMKVEAISMRWQIGITGVPSPDTNSDILVQDTKGNKTPYLIDRADFYFDGQLVGSLDRTQFSFNNSYAHGAYICVKTPTGNPIHYNSQMQPSPYVTTSRQEYDQIYNKGVLTYFHNGTGQQAFVPGCTLTADEVDNPYMYDHGVLYDLQGNVVFRTAQAYDSVGEFKNGYAQVRINRLYGLIDLTGREVIPPIYEELSYTDTPLLHGFIGAVKDGKFGFLNADGEVTCDFVYSSSIVRDRETFAYLQNLDGSTIILSAAVGEFPEHYDELYMFGSSNEKMAFVVKNSDGDKCMIDIWGNVILPWGSYRDIELNRAGTVAIVQTASREFRILQLSIPDYIPYASADVEAQDEHPVTAVPVDDGTWTCPNGHGGNTGKFCSECGAPKPAADDGTWTCVNGHSGNTGKFCTECGAPKPTGDGSPVQDGQISGDPVMIPQPTAVPAQAEPIRFSFSWNEPESINYDEINAELSKVLLSGLDIENLSGYLVTTTHYESDRITGLSYDYWLSAAEFVGEQDETAGLHHFKIEAYTYPSEEKLTAQTMISAWEAEHPDRYWYLIRTVQWDEAVAFVILYYDRND